MHSRRPVNRLYLIKDKGLENESRVRVILFMERLYEVCSSVTGYIFIVLQNSVALVHPYLSFLLWQ